MKKMFSFKKTAFCAVFAICILLSVSKSKATTENTGGADITCPDGNKYTCATLPNGSIFWKGEGGTVVVL